MSYNSEISIPDIAVVLLLRVYAMYNQNKLMLVIILAGFASTTTASAVLVGTSVHRFHGVLGPYIFNHLFLLANPKVPFFQSPYKLFH